MAQSFLTVLISLVSSSKILLCFPLGFLRLVPAWRCSFGPPWPEAASLCPALSPSPSVPSPGFPEPSGAWAVSPLPRSHHGPAKPWQLLAPSTPRNPCPQIPVPSLCAIRQFLVDPSSPLCFLPSSAAALSWSCPCPSLPPLPLGCDPFLLL